MKKTLWFFPLLASLTLSACSLVPTSAPVPSVPVVPTPASESGATVSSQEALPASSVTSLPSSATVQVTKSALVSIQNFTFTPSNLRITKGTKVIWKNDDAAPHLIASDGKFPESATLEQGQSYSFTFTDAGTFPYHCSIHPSMQGTVEVVQ